MFLSQLVPLLIQQLSQLKLCLDNPKFIHDDHQVHCIDEEPAVVVGEHLLHHQGELSREEECFQDFKHVGVGRDLVIVDDQDLGLEIEESESTVA